MTEPYFFAGPTTLFPEVSHVGGFAVILCAFGELSKNVLLDGVNFPEDRVSSRVRDGYVAFSIIPTLLTDDGTQARCVLNGTNLFSEIITLGVRNTPPPAGM